MNRTSLDSIGLAGFSHNFSSLSSSSSSSLPTETQQILAAFAGLPMSHSPLRLLLFLLSPLFPMLVKMRSELGKCQTVMRGVGKEVLQREKGVREGASGEEGSENGTGKSIIGLLSAWHFVFRYSDFKFEYEVKAENSTGELGMSEEEVFAQVGCPCRIRSSA
jgi:hypothetical protein